MGAERENGNHRQHEKHHGGRNQNSTAVSVHFPLKTRGDCQSGESPSRCRAMTINGALAANSWKARPLFLRTMGDKMRYRIATPLLAACLLASLAHAQQESPITQVDESQIAAWIEQLASTNSAPVRKEEGHQVLRRPVNWDEEAQNRVQEAYARLAQAGKQAFPQLLQSLQDIRYSMTVAYAEEVNLSVGDACRRIITNQIEVVGMRYKSRLGADGKSHMCPGFIDNRYRGNLPKWWRENKEKSLVDMQVDALSWRIAQEARIGFTNQEQHDRYMGELLDKLSTLEAKQELLSEYDAQYRVEQLIQQLVFDVGGTSKQPALSSDSEEYAQRFRQSQQAFKELMQLKEEAFPVLVAHLDDKRPSVPFRNHIANSSVGYACYLVIYYQLQDRPEGYSRYGYQRLGRDGEQHVQPYWDGSPFDQVGGVDRWLAANQDLNYVEKQIKCLQWLLDKEKAIGAPDADSYFINILPLEIQILKRRFDNGEDVARELKHLQRVQKEKLVEEVPAELLPPVTDNEADYGTLRSP